MKSLYLALFAAFVPLTQASAALLTYDFEGYAPDTETFRTGNTQNITGWTQNSVNYSADGEEYPFGYLLSGNTGKAAVLGTYYASVNPLASPSTPGGLNTSLTGDLSSAGSNLQNSQVSLDFSLLAYVNNLPNLTSIEDNFSITIGGSNVASAASVYFTADVANGGWNLSYAFNGGSYSGSTLIAAANLFNLSFTFLDDTASIAVGNTVIGQVDSSAFNSGTLSNIVVKQIEQGAGSQNVITFDNVTVNAVPEPTIAALGALGALTLLRRRRQA